MMVKPGGREPVEKIAFLENVKINDHLFIVESSIYLG